MRTARPTPSKSDARRAALADAIWDADPPPRRTLDVTYVLPHQNVTGGMKILLEHVRRLRACGHRVRCVLRHPSAARAIPPWSDAAADEEVLLRAGQSARAAVPRTDVVLVGWFQNLPEWADAGHPVLYFEQGHELLFGDVPPGPAGAALEAQLEAALRLPVPVAAVSSCVAELVARRFGRRAGVVTNGIDTARFRPDGHAPGRRVLLVGHPALPFKDFATALETVRLTHAAVPDLSLTWVSQVPARLSAPPFPYRNVVAPPQGELPAIYAAHDALLFTSRYEAFSLPPLEAMASGVPVVTTQCGGVTTFARPGWNCAMAPPGRAPALASALATVLRQPACARALAERGRRTAERFSWDAAIQGVEDALLRTAQRRP